MIHGVVSVYADAGFLDAVSVDAVVVVVVFLIMMIMMILVMKKGAYGE